MPPCVAYDPERQSWGAKNLEGSSENEALCPHNHAFVGTLRPTGRVSSPAELPVAGFCCPLPADALTNESSESESLCPEEAIATGVRRPVIVNDPSFGAPTTPLFFLRCTTVNRSRYRLGPRLPGGLASLYTRGLDFAFLRRLAFSEAIQEQRVNMNRVSPRIRYAIGRISYSSWGAVSCVGLPVGAFLSGKLGKTCAQHEFRELIPLKESEKNAAGDSCRAIDSIYSTEPHCLPE